MKQLDIIIENSSINKFGYIESEYISSCSQLLMDKFYTISNIINGLLEGSDDVFYNTIDQFGNNRFVRLFQPSVVLTRDNIVNIIFVKYKNVDNEIIRQNKNILLENLNKVNDIFLVQRTEESAKDLYNRRVVDLTKIYFKFDNIDNAYICIGKEHCDGNDYFFERYYMINDKLCKHLMIKL